MITYEVHVCIGQDNPNKRIAVKCHDTGVNLLVLLQVWNHGKWLSAMEPYQIPDGSTAVIKIAKADNTYCVCDGELAGGGALFRMPPQAFTAAGVARAEVSIFGPDTRRLTSATFDIDVPEECTHDCEEESGSFVDVMGKQIQAAIDAADRAENCVVHPPRLSETHTWLVWDLEQDRYVDTGITATDVTAENIEFALGYVPAKAEDVAKLESEVHISDEKVLEMLTESGIVTPASDGAAVYMDSDGKVFVL